jgi:hypothetical protein
VESLHEAAHGFKPNGPTIIRTVKGMEKTELARRSRSAPEEALGMEDACASAQLIEKF